MKQYTLFKKESEAGAYTSKTDALVYQPNGKKPHILELYNSAKTQRLTVEIQASNLPQDEKTFLLEAAKRHTVFNYEKIADYYAHASAEMQNLMERSALVIVDFEKAIELGYIRLSDKIRKQYLEEYE